MNKHLFVNIIIGAIILYLIFLFVPPLDVGWVNDILPNELSPEDNLEGFCIKRSKSSYRHYLFTFIKSSLILSYT